MRNLVIFVCAAIFLVACSVQKPVKIDILKPAELTFTPPIDTAILVVKVNPNALSPEFSIGKKTANYIREKQPSYYNDAFKDFNNYSPLLYVKYTLALFQNDYTIKPLDKDYIKQLCDSFGVKTIIGLEYYEISDTIQVNYGPDYLTTSIYNILNKSLWRVYSYSGKLLDQYKTETMIPVTQVSGYRDYDKDDFFFITPLDAIKSSCYNASVEYFTRISPIWISEKRTVYSYAAGYLPMIKGAKLAQKGEWERAVELWERLNTNSDKVVAARACFNLSVYEEIKDDLEMAIFWAKKSYELDEELEVANYITVLEKRQNEKELLKKQLGY